MLHGDELIPLRVVQVKRIFPGEFFLQHGKGSAVGDSSSLNFFLLLAIPFLPKKLKCFLIR